MVPPPDPLPLEGVARGALPTRDVPLWRNRDFVLLWIAQAISQTAQNAIWYGMMVLVQTRSHSSTQMSLAIMTLIVPSVLFGIIAGAYVDRWDKRAVLIATNALRSLVTLGYVFFSEILGLVYLVNFLFSTIGQFFAPAEAAMIPTIVPRRRLLQANSLFHLTFTASQLIGIVLLGPLVVNLLGVHGLFGLVAVLIGLCAALVWPLPRATGGTAHAEGEIRSLSGLWRDVAEVGAFMRCDPQARMAVGHWTLGATLGMVIAMLAPGFSESVLGVRAEDSVFVLAPAGVGMLAATAILGRIGHYLRKDRLIVGGLVLVGLTLVALGLLRPVMNLIEQPSLDPFALPPDPARPVLVAVVMATTFVAGGGFVAVIVASQTIIQERAPVEIRGRVFAVQLMLTNLVSIGPLLFLGGLADLIGVARTLVLLGLSLLLAAYLTVRSQRALPSAGLEAWSTLPEPLPETVEPPTMRRR